MSETHHQTHHEPAHHAPTPQTPYYQGQGGLLDAPPKTTFVMGFLAGIVLTAVVGLFFVFPSVAQNAKTSGNNKIAGAAINGNTNTAPTAPSAADNGPTIGNFRAVSDSDHIRGDKKAPLTIVEWSDMECPYCERFHPTMQKIINEYKGKVRWIYRHFPLSSLHPNAEKGAEGSECATELGGNDAFWKFADKMLGISGQTTQDDLVTYAKDIGLDATKFKSCLDSGKYKQKVQDDYNDAAAAGGQGTPYSVLIDSKGEKSAINGAQPYEAVKAMIDAKL